MHYSSNTIPPQCHEVGSGLARNGYGKMALVMTLDYLKQEASEGNRSDFDRFLSLVPNEPPAAGDEMPNH